MNVHDESGGFCDNYWYCFGDRDKILEEISKGVRTLAESWPPTECNFRVKARNRQEAELPDPRSH